MGDYVGLGSSDLFSFDRQAALESNILYDNDTLSMNEYDEYVVYNKPHTETGECYGCENGDGHTTHKVSYDDKEGAGVLDNAFRRGQLVDYTVRPTYSNLDQWKTPNRTQRLTHMEHQG